MGACTYDPITWGDSVLEEHAVFWFTVCYFQLSII
jgi:hypothetical protein